MSGSYGGRYRPWINGWIDTATCDRAPRPAASEHEWCSAEDTPLGSADVREPFQRRPSGNRETIEAFKATVPANPGLLFDFRNSLREWLLHSALDGAPRDGLVLAVHEAVANGMQHGSGSPVLVTGRMDEREVTVEIMSRGLWTAQRRREGLFDERGRGLALIRGLTDGLDVIVDGGCVMLRLRVADEDPT